MHVNHASSYAKQFGVSLDMQFECSASECSNKVAVKDGFAFPGRSKASGEISTYFFCGTLCYFNAVPLEACYAC